MKLKDTINELSHHVIDTLQQYPVVKGIIPSVGAGSLTLINELEIGLRITGLVVMILGGCLTGYAQWLKVKKLKNGE